MRYMVEFFDGKDILKLMVEQDKLAELQYRLNRMDPVLGVTILSVEPITNWAENGKTAPHNRRNRVPTTAEYPANISSSETSMDYRWL